MKNETGFTLIEIIVTLIILGIVTAMILPSYTASILRGESQNAQNNLIAIYGAQNTYYLSNGNYCIAGCDSLPDIILPANLNLSLTDPYFQYQCAATPSLNPQRTTGFTCTAKTANATLTLTDAPLSSGANPICAPAGSSYCPS